jgi:hypothetical protein
MQDSTSTLRPVQQSWTYVKLTVVDGSRQLKPCEISFDEINFNNPPYLTSDQVEIIITNGDEEDRHIAAVLPHDADATRIPIRLVSNNIAAD